MNHFIWRSSFKELFLSIHRTKMNLALKTSTAILTALLMLTTLTAWGLAPGEPNIFLQVSPESQSIPPGGSGNFTISLTPQEGFEGEVRLNVTSPPTGINATFSPNPVNVQAFTQANSSMQVTVASTAPTGNITLNIFAIGVTDAKVNKTANVTITIGGVLPPGGNTTTTTTPTNTTTTTTNTTTTTSPTNTTTTTSPFNTTTTTTTTTNLTTTTSPTNTTTTTTNTTTTTTPLFPTNTTTTTTNTTETAAPGGIAGLSAELTYAAIGIIVIVIIAAIAIAASRRK